ncbi:hypothetical protein M2326_001335 [Flavobacterium sp. 7A]|nr:hypothetical protein [Flavobacterium sp. 7A]
MTIPDIKWFPFARNEYFIYSKIKSYSPITYRIINSIFSFYFYLLDHKSLILIWLILPNSPFVQWIFLSKYQP